MGISEDNVARKTTTLVRFRVEAREMVGIIYLPVYTKELTLG